MRGPKNSISLYNEHNHDVTDEIYTYIPINFTPLHPTPQLLNYKHITLHNNDTHFSKQFNEHDKILH